VGGVRKPKEGYRSLLNFVVWLSLKKSACFVVEVKEYRTGVRSVFRFRISTFLK